MPSRASSGDRFQSQSSSAKAPILHFPYTYVPLFQYQKKSLSRLETKFMLIKPFPSGFDWIGTASRVKRKCNRPRPTAQQHGECNGRTELSDKDEGRDALPRRLWQRNKHGALKCARMRHIVVAERRIFVIGPMGAGKSTVGRHLADELDFDFFDADEEIESRTGASVSLIFDIEGESGFRKRECLLLDELTQLDKTVLATGGGVVLAEENRHLLKTRGFVVYLKTSLETLVERTRLDDSRPLLRTKEPEKTLADILEARKPLYTEIADIAIDCGELSVAQIVKKIIEAI